MRKGTTMNAAQFRERTRIGRFARALSAIVGVVGLLNATSAPGCPFCAKMGKTYSDTMAEASLVVWGELSDSRVIPDASADQAQASTRMKLRQVVKDHPLLAGKADLTLASYVPRAQKRTVSDVVFAEVVDGRVEPFRSIPAEPKTASSGDAVPELVAYLAKAARLAGAKPADRLGYFAGYLAHPDPNISEDAYKEFAKAPYADVVAAKAAYRPDELIRWIRDPATPAYRIGLFGVLLGISGRPQDATVLRAIVSSPADRPYDGVDGLMAGYCLLDPKNAPDEVFKVLLNPTAGFRLRYAALEAIRFALAEIPSLDKPTLLDRLSEALAMPELADLVIDELRKNEAWSHLDQILELRHTTGFDLPVIQRTIVRFALACPHPKAKAFIEQLRADDPQMVAEVEESLRFEQQIQEQFRKK